MLKGFYFILVSELSGFALRASARNLRCLICE